MTQVEFTNIVLRDGKRSEKIFLVTLESFKQAYPEYFDELVEKKCIGDAIGQGWYFTARVI